MVNDATVRNMTDDEYLRHVAESQDPVVVELAWRLAQRIDVEEIARRMATDSLNENEEE